MTRTQLLRCRFGLLCGLLLSAATAAQAAFIRFRVDHLPEQQAPLTITASIHVHRSPWTHRGLRLTPNPVSETGWTDWVDLRALPGGANGSLVFSVPEGMRGLTRFSTAADDDKTVRDIAWDEPDGTRIIVMPDLSDVRTFRDQERRYYLRSLQQTGETLLPLARPPLFFGNAWGRATGGAAEYMVKSFRLMGLNNVSTAEDHALYEKLYGWTTHDAQYQPPRFMPFDEEAAQKQYRENYKKFFEGRAAASPEMLVFQMSDEPREIGIDISKEEVVAGFRRWLATQGLSPKHFEAKSWDDVAPLLDRPKNHVSPLLDNQRYYWTRRYQSFLTPRMFSLAAEAIRATAPNPAVQSFVALSGHALYMPSQMPLDMFELARYPGLMPGISDWMTGGSWNWDGHEAVAFSVAPYNAGARRYGDDFGKTPRSFPMMHCVNPSLLRAHTQLANQCKLISYYTYGPDYLATEGFWSNQRWGANAVQHINRQSALVDDILGPGIMRPSRVAMLYSRSQEIWWPRQTFPDKRATFLALAHNYYQPELVTEEQITEGALAHYDALVLVEHFVSGTAQDAIEAWVNKGGLLWACADAGVADEYNQQRDLLKNISGLVRQGAPYDHSVQFVPREGETALKEHEVPPRDRFHQIPIRNMVMKEWPGAKVRADYSDGLPALVEKRVGKGKMVYLGHRAGSSYSRRAGARGELRWWPDGRREVLSVPLEDAGVERDLLLSGPLVMSGVLSTEAGSVVILYNLAGPNEARAGLTVSLKERARPHSVQQVSGGSLVDVDFKYVDGRVVISDWTLPGSGAMLLVRRSPPPVDERLGVMRTAAAKHIQSGDWQTISAGAWFAGFFPQWGMAESLLPLVNHEHWAVRRSAVESLGRLGHAPAAKRLRDAIDREQDAHVLAELVTALTRLNHRDAAGLRKRFGTHASPVIREEVARAEDLAAAGGR